jgi:two-component system NarL family response regulator
MPHILLVEDNIDMLMLLREMLEWAGYQVSLGRTGEEAMELLATGALPDLIISDLTMPRMDGITLYQHVRANPNWSQVRFIIMSANIFDERLQTQAAIGLDGIIPKPFNLGDLSTVLQT